MGEGKKKTYPQSRAWIELNRDHLRHNVALLESLLPPGCKLMPAVKANAYGHGALLLARELNQLGVANFCVASAGEGVQLREGGVQGDILVLGYTHPAEFPLLTRHRLTQTALDRDYAALLDREAAKIAVHVGIDTGMRRLGVDWRNLDAMVEIFAMEHLRVTGLFTHLCADDPGEGPGREITDRQKAALDEVVRGLHARGITPPTPHILNSGGLLRRPDLGGAFARVGIALYGTLSTREEWERCPLDLRPVLSLRARVAQVRTLAPGEGAGYGLTFQAAGETRLAVLSIGYADGLPRSLSGGVGRVLLRGCLAPIAGRICMDQTLVDVTAIPQVQAGEIATLIGSWGGETITPWDLAQQAGTISNEILSRLGSRLERILV